MKSQSIKASTPEQIDHLAALLKFNIPEKGWRITYLPWREKRSLDQNSLQHVIYQEISTYLITRGRTDCTPEWIKDMLKNRFLGWEEKEFTDIVTGEKKMHEVLRSTAALDKGEAYHYTTHIIEWASSIGCEIKIPARCEYRDLMEEQNGE